MPGDTNDQRTMLAAVLKGKHPKHDSTLGWLSPKYLQLYILDISTLEEGCPKIESYLMMPFNLMLICRAASTIDCRQLVFLAEMSSIPWRSRFLLRAIEPLDMLCSTTLEVTAFVNNICDHGKVT